ncbi:GWxTD domain-containing protein [candidate division KSB1 bacterium]
MNKLVYKIILTICFLILFNLLHVSAQTPIIRQSENPFNVYFLTMPSLEKGTFKALVLLQMTYDKIRFLKRDESFIARYEISVEIMDGTDEVVERKFWTEEIVTESFEKTLISSDFFLEPLEFILRPGLYRYHISMKDMDSRKTFERKNSKIFPSYWAEIVGFSDLIYTAGFEETVDYNKLLPSSELMKISYRDGFSLHLKVFSADLQPLDISFEILDFFNKNIVPYHDDLSIKPTENIMDFRISFNGGRILPGTYLFRGIIKHPGRVPKEIIERFSFTWTDRPIDSYDFELSLEQMEYILTDEEKERVKNFDDTTKKIFFEQYWNSKDPTPDTQRNELLEEYFHRVEYSNQHFSFRSNPGWRTDRGEIYCLWGQPDIRVPGDLNFEQVPMEIWTYERAKKRFTFIDSNRTGRFRLYKVEDIR